jgi:hypothetical protein
MDKAVDPQAVLQKMAAKIANLEVKNAMLEVALESARKERSGQQVPDSPGTI